MEIRKIKDSEGCTVYDGRPESVPGESAAETAVYDFLDNTGVGYKAMRHPAAYTMEECEKVRRVIDAPVFKNLFLTNKQHTAFFLLVMPPYKVFKTKYLSGQLGCARLSFASAEEMERFLKIHPGAVSPMGLIHDSDRNVRLLLDSDLKPAGMFACHPCVNTATVALQMVDLLDKVLPATGHDFVWVDLPDGASEGRSEP